MDKKVGIEIQGSIFADNGNIDHDDFTEKFIKFVESNGWNFGGGTKSVDENGNALKD